MSDFPRAKMADVIDFTVSTERLDPKATPKRLSIMSALATGWLPWGIEWHPSLTFAWDVSERGRTIDRVFILCCNHTMRPKEAQAFVSAGLLVAGVDRSGGEALVITTEGRAWLERNWIS